MFRGPVVRGEAEAGFLEGLVGFAPAPCSPEEIGEHEPGVDLPRCGRATGQSALYRGRVEAEGRENLALIAQHGRVAGECGEARGQGGVCPLGSARLVLDAGSQKVVATQAAADLVRVRQCLQGSFEVARAVAHLPEMEQKGSLGCAAIHSLLEPGRGIRVAPPLQVDDPDQCERRRRLRPTGAGRAADRRCARSDVRRHRDSPPAARDARSRSARPRSCLGARLPALATPPSPIAVRRSAGAALPAGPGAPCRRSAAHLVRSAFRLRGAPPPHAARPARGRAIRSGDRGERRRTHH